MNCAIPCIYISTLPWILASITQNVYARTLKTCVHPSNKSHNFRMLSLFWAFLTLSTITAPYVESRILLCRSDPKVCAKKAAIRVGERMGLHPPPVPAMPGTSYSHQALQYMLDEALNTKAILDTTYLHTATPPGVLPAEEKISNKISELQSALAEQDGTSKDVHISQPSPNSAETASKVSSKARPSNLAPSSLLLLLIGGASGVGVAYFYRRYLGK